MGVFDTIRRFLGLSSGEPSGPSASDVMRDMRAEKGRSDPEWIHLRNRFATLVLGEADQQRLWKRAHRGASTSARLLSGITAPTPDEMRILDALVRELESGR